MCAGITTLVFLFIVGLGEYAVALAAVVALLDVIPMIGATLGAVVVSAIGFATDLKIGIACVIFYVVYQQFENYLIYPRVMSRSVDIPGSVTVIAALIGASLLGVVGALLAIPTAAAVMLLRAGGLHPASRTPLLLSGPARHRLVLVHREVVRVGAGVGGLHRAVPLPRAAGLDLRGDPRARSRRGPSRRHPPTGAWRPSIATISACGTARTARAPRSGCR